MRLRTGPPNMRVQRTRSSPSALREPLTRHPLGAVCWSLAWGIAAVVATGCATSTTWSDPASVPRVDISVVRRVRVKVSASNAKEECDILNRLVRDLEAALPAVSFIREGSPADLEIVFQRSDWMVCVDCDQEGAFNTQYW